jgi:HPt (histidine-containing phosphotransfer) domain-containing protein
MPVMDGLETTAKILELDASIPIVALTANVMSHDHDVYKTIGIRDCVGKPFTSQELWRCLMVYFEPVTWQREDINQRKQADNELKQKLIDNFVKNNQEKYKEINDALNEGDIKLAHRLVHTLKSTAGSLDKVLLQQAAAEVESCLAGGENHVTPQQLKMLKTELVAALAELTPFVSKPRPSADSLEMLSIEASRELLGKLEPLLIKGSTECLKMIETLRTVPGSEELIRQIEDFDFKLAHGTLKKLLGELK